MKKKIKQWVLAFRPVSTIFAGLLTYDGFILVGKTIDWILISLVMLITSTTMLQNDYFDRFNDRRKGKDLAYNNPISFVVLLTILWALSILGIMYYFYYREEILYSGILTICVLIGFFYSFTRTIEYLPTLLVAIFWGNLTLFCFDLKNIESLILIVLWPAIFFLNIGSEILQDVKDSETDIDYKVTLLTTGLSKRKAVLFSAGFIGASLIFCF